MLTMKREFESIRPAPHFCMVRECICRDDRSVMVLINATYFDGSLQAFTCNIFSSIGVAIGVEMATFFSRADMIARKQLTCDLASSSDCLF